VDLTGAPTESIDLGARHLDLGALWQRLVEFRRLRLPMGCGTDGGSGLDLVGLCNSHAYSILDVREVDVVGPLDSPTRRGPSTQAGAAEVRHTAKLLRIR
jgi:hypothetical protein